MAQVRESWDLDHPVEDVWSLLIDPDRWMEWNTGLSDMRDEVVLNAPHGLLGRPLDGLVAEPLLRRALRGNRERVRRALGRDA